MNKKGRTVLCLFVVFVSLLALVSCGGNGLRVNIDGNVAGRKMVGAVEIPSEIDGKTVKGVMKYGFSAFNSKDDIYELNGGNKDKRNEITSIVLPDTIETIEEGAFSGSKITSIVIPPGVKTISRFAFAYCDSLTEIILPDGLEEIEYDAFLGCTSLIKITIPKSVREIGSGAFRECVNLEEVVISNNVRDIGSGAFENCKRLTSFIVPKGVQKIWGNTFSGCINLTSVTLSSNVDTIDYRAFYNCSLAYVSLPEHLEMIGFEAFWGNDFETITIPGNVNEIGNNAFGQCNQLKTINFKGTTAKWYKIKPDSLFAGGAEGVIVKTSDTTLKYGYGDSTSSTNYFVTPCDHDWTPTGQSFVGANKITWYRCTKCGEETRVVTPNL